MYMFINTYTYIHMYVENGYPLTLSLSLSLWLPHICEHIFSETNFGCVCVCVCACACVRVYVCACVCVCVCVGPRTDLDWSSICASYQKADKAQILKKKNQSTSAFPK